MTKVIVLFLLFLSGCSNLEPEVLDQNSGLSSFQLDWYSSHLRAAREPKLGQQGNESYRFVWLRSFHRPIVIRISCSAECTLFTKILSGKGGYEPGRISESQERVISKEELEKFKSKLADSEFWKGQPESEIIVTDGAVWMFEATANNDYKLWSVTSPHYEEQYINYIDLCRYLISLSNLEIPDSEFY